MLVPKAHCPQKSPRFATYCPYCQIARLPRSSDSERPEAPIEPPPYDAIESEVTSGSLVSYITPPPPSYEHRETRKQQESDVIHHLHPGDSLTSISFAYRVPIPTLRSHNRLHADHLLSARRTLQIPRSHYKGTSLSPEPIEGAEECERKSKLRKFMVGCKCADYKVATLYLEEAGWQLGEAVGRWKADEQWEKTHPMGKGKRTRRTRGAFGRYLS